MVKKQKVKLLLKDSYLRMIENSVGADIWRNLYAEINGKRKDVLKDGELSCTFFVSSVLLIFGLISKMHATVKGTIEDMKKSGWKEIKKPKLGCVLLWEKVKFPSGSENFHLGFYVKADKAVSNRWEVKSPKIHHWTYGTKKGGLPKRKIEKIFWHKKLDEE